MKIVICGSMSAAKQMVQMGETLTSNGHEVVLPVSADNYALAKLQAADRHESVKQKIENNLIREYYLKISDADAVVIANFDKNGIANYVGGNSFLEAGFAHAMNKKLYFLNNIPDMSYSDELKAMQPIILNGDLFLIK